MSQDFVRRLPGSDLSKASRMGWSESIHMDLPILLLLIAVSGYGLLILYSAVGQQSEPVIAQSIKIALACGAMILLAQISPIFYMRIAVLLYSLGLILLVLVLLFGPEINGSRRWIRIPGAGGFQPAELMKLVVPLILAWYFQDRHLPPKNRHIAWAIVMIAIPVILIARQPDLGTSILIGMSGVFVLLLAGISLRFVMGVLAALTVSAPGMWFLLRDYQQQRILTLLNPERDPLGAGWNIIQSKTAIGSGGLFGKGIFQGTQSHLEFLPESHTDFIIAVLAEELGLFGVVILLILYILLISRGLIIAIQAQDTFGRLLAGSITFTFFVYVFVNIAMVSGVLPVVGVPLPLVSYGGTSIVTLFAGFGVLMSIHTHRRITL